MSKFTTIKQKKTIPVSNHEHFNSKTVYSFCYLILLYMALKLKILGFLVVEYDIMQLNFVVHEVMAHQFVCQ